MKFPHKGISHVYSEHKKVDGKWLKRVITAHGDVEVTLDSEGLYYLALRALKNKNGRAVQGYLKAKIVKRDISVTGWRPFDF